VLDDVRARPLSELYCPVRTTVVGYDDLVRVVVTGEDDAPDPYLLVVRRDAYENTGVLTVLTETLELTSR
jgi:hypothetical protein